MATTIDKQTFQRLTLLYLISRFGAGVYSSFRLQKLLFRATREVTPRPFTFHLTRYGQYSRDAAVELLHLFESELLRRENLNGNFDGARWQAPETAAFRQLCEAFEEGLPAHAAAICESVGKFGHLEQRALDELAKNDPLLRRKRRGSVLIREHPAPRIPIALDEDTAEELEMMLSPPFLQAIAQLDAAVAAGGFDLNQVPTLPSIDAILR